jgi:hypothetical protein
MAHVPCLRAGILGLTFLFLSCSPFMHYCRYEYYPEQASGIRRVMVAPLDMVRELPKGMGVRHAMQLESAIAGYLTAHGLQVEPSRALVEAWQSEAVSAGGFFDPLSGAVDSVKIRRALARAMAEAQKTTPVDAVILAQIVKRDATLAGDHVYWDGCARRFVDSRGDVVTDGDFRGEADGLSLQVGVYDAEQYAVFRSCGGLLFPYAVLETYQHREFVWKIPKTLDSLDAQASVRTAFHPFVPWDRYPQNPRYGEEPASCRGDSTITVVPSQRSPIPRSLMAPK